jgi:hypothetical protein
MNTSWPQQQKPSANDWRIWQLFLKKTFILRGLRLLITLGKWLQWDNDWEWYFSPSQECLFQYSSAGWTSFSQVHKRDKLPTFLTNGTSTSKPADLKRAMIYMNKNRIVCTGYTPILSPPISTANTFLHYLGRSDPGEKWCLDYIDMKDNGHILAEAIQQGTAIAVSDGSFQDQYGIAAWVYWTAFRGGHYARHLPRPICIPQRTRWYILNHGMHQEIV